MKSTFLPALLIVILTIISCTDSTRKNPRNLSEANQKIDEAIWNASFQDLEGNEVTVADLKGKVVLIDFWETWCGPCLQVFPAMDSLQNEYPDDFVVVAVNLNDSDTLEDVRNFKENNDYDFKYVLDVNNVGDEVITLGIPFKVFVDPQGYLIKAELGLSGSDYQDTKEIIEQNKTS
ncbi:MAG: TlpA family protein disulfide reductase [Gracilimonas sp.]|uniref:TlpA family protein disulfide reductase n=1 Tax=Gracilimonas TaxID=649462 RepID=UPI001B2BB7D7|nr:TlpA disulfide reductase family protein [Gracilimonas sp.]MBO6584557.1 TlpA family protein disulfide reductase [Gracilimonas sp.]MBO6616172.1 TlpA family protein disulfide reductase [Gracilimonas sp.]